MFSYPEWSRDAYLQRIAPVIARIADPVVAAECGPGPGAGQYRLYPGSLFLLWSQAIGSPQVSPGAETVAAALEMLHNSSLLHDDVLDEHEKRRGQATLLGSHGRNFSMLAGDSLMAGAMKVLSDLSAERMGGILARLADAVSSMVMGQRNDEPDVWRQVKVADREQHWLRIASQKLALGNVSSSLAAFWCSRRDMEAGVRQIMDDFSVVSQIINDFGDLLDFAGYHEIGASGRPVGEEALRKPTLPMIWAGVLTHEGIADIRSLNQRAKAEIGRRKTEALERLNQLDLDTTYAPILADFFTRPSLPEFD
jgi:geranylgeranyl pyrophosphate synthase